MGPVPPKTDPAQTRKTWETFGNGNLQNLGFLFASGSVATSWDILEIFGWVIFCDGSRVSDNMLDLFE